MTQVELQTALTALALTMPRDDLIRALLGVAGGVLLADSDRREVAEYFRRVADMIEQQVVH